MESKEMCFSDSAFIYLLVTLFSIPAFTHYQHLFSSSSAPILPTNRFVNKLKAVIPLIRHHFRNHFLEKEGKLVITRVIHQGQVPERRNISIPGIYLFFRDNFIPGINSATEGIALFRE